MTTPAVGRSPFVRNQPELVLILRPGPAIHAAPPMSAAAALGATPALSDLGASVRVMSLFGETEDRLQFESRRAAPPGAPPPVDLASFYRVEAPGRDLHELAAELRRSDRVLAAYVKPSAEPATLLVARPPNLAHPPTVTPDYSARQGYLDPAPGGIDARLAWTLPGGRGSSVGVIDVEGEWRFTHEDLLINQGGVIGGTPPHDLLWRDHGTAVVGTIGGDANSIGITGISGDAYVRAVSIFPSGMGSAAAIRHGANALNPGDILLVEVHYPGPRFNFQDRYDQRGYIAVEWWPDDFAAIQYATRKGVIVVEAAGNGAEDLDAPLYDTPAQGFPPDWSNPFNRHSSDSGAILVGAGAPPPGTHGRDHGPDRSRLEFSNYGSAIDAQGWGREVTTCGYGDLQKGPNEDGWYTDEFAGTSSASPIVVGALAALQGIARARGVPLTPAAARGHLRSTGSPQQDAPGRPATQRIGNRPDLRALIGCL